RPFSRYWVHASPCFPQTTTVCHSVACCFSPFAPTQVLDVARENLVTAFPFGVKRVSGSLPRFPIRITLFTISFSFRSFQLLDSDSLFASPISFGRRYSVPASPKSTRIKVLPMFSLALTKIPSLDSMSPVRWERMDIIVLIFSPGFMLFARVNSCTRQPSSQERWEG